MPLNDWGQGDKSRNYGPGRGGPTTEPLRASSWLLMPPRLLPPPLLQETARGLPLTLAPGSNFLLLVACERKKHYARWVAREAPASHAPCLYLVILDLTVDRLLIQSAAHSHKLRQETSESFSDTCEQTVKGARCNTTWEISRKSCASTL